ncbi:MAG: threonine/serine dehydratase [Acidimicrobiales bacterium]
MLSIGDVRAAAVRLEGLVERTPVVTNRGLNALAGAEVFLKAECLQVTGSFKFRGASNAVAQLSLEERHGGLITYSSGNHAQAVAAAAKAAGASALVVMPDDAPLEKVAAVDALGARIVRYDRYRENRVAIAEALADFEGRAMIPPYDHEAVMAGQGTVALELLDDHPDLDALFVPVGGGGLLAGCATVAHARASGIKVYGVEPEAGDDHRRSRRAGKRVDVGVPVTIADGQQVSTPGRLTWPITNKLTTQFVTVTDDQITAAMAALFERTNLLVEPSGASALAAVLSAAAPVAGLRVGVVLSGGNIGWPRFRELTGR